MTALLCPDEDLLLPMVYGEAPSLEISSHVQDCPSCRVRLEQLRREVATLRQVSTAWQAAPPAPSPIQPERPAVIGKYFIAGVLGEGGEAVVYRGLHPTLGKDVAIKWSRQPLDSDSNDSQRLVSEGKLLASLEHANLVRVFDLDFHEGRPFLVMEYVRGGILEERALREPPLTPLQAAALVAPVARAAALAHQHGITHQDIKPRNILLHEDGRPMLSDFGLARLRARPESGPFGGTPGFMAPEQARGEVEHIGPASDIFGLGGVLYFLLTRRLPFVGKDALVVLQEAMQGKIDLSGLEAAKTPRPLAAACRRALAAAPQDRYPTAAALAEDLEHYLRLPQRRRVLLAVVAGAAALAAVYFLRPEPAAPLVKPPGPELPRGFQMLIVRLTRGRLKPAGLAEAVPLRTKDQFQIECLVPAQMQVGLFSLDANQRFDQFKEIALAPAGPLARLTYPNDGQKVRLGAGSGTEVLLVAASRAPLRLTEIEKLLRGAGPWPELSDHTALVMNPDEARVPEGMRALEVVPGDPTTLALDRLDKLRLALRQAGCDYCAAVVFPHRD